MRLSFNTQRLLFFSGRLNIFLFLWALMLFALFLLSNYQQFLDFDQLLIMDLLAAALFLHLVTGLFYLLFPLFAHDPSYRISRRRLVVTIIALSLSLLLFFILEFFYVWMSF